MTMLNLIKKYISKKREERGNVLFLILIAVALFAALSYAVTQSTRSGGGDASRETTVVNASQITQYPASIKTAMTRMILTNSISPDDFKFDPPPFTGLTTTTLQSQGVFYPGSTTGGGGGAPYVQAPSSVMESKAPGTWYFNGENQIKDIGTYDATLSTSNADIVAYLPGVTLAVCQSVHQRLGMNVAIPDLNAAALITGNSMDASDPNIDAGGATITHATLDGQPQGCFQKPTGTYIYYHVLIER